MGDMPTQGEMRLTRWQEDVPELEWTWWQWGRSRDGVAATANTFGSSRGMAVLTY